MEISKLQRSEYRLYRSDVCIVRWKVKERMEQGHPINKQIAVTWRLGWTRMERCWGWVWYVRQVIAILLYTRCLSIAGGTRGETHGEHIRGTFSSPPRTVKTLFYFYSIFLLRSPCICNIWTVVSKPLAFIRVRFY